MEFTVKALTRTSRKTDIINPPGYQFISLIDNDIDFVADIFRQKKKEFLFKTIVNALQVVLPILVFMYFIEDNEGRRAFPTLDFLKKMGFRSGIICVNQFPNSTYIRQPTQHNLMSLSLFFVFLLAAFWRVLKGSPVFPLFL